MKEEGGTQRAETRDIWVVVLQRDGLLRQETYGLMGEALRLRSVHAWKGKITAVVLGSGIEQGLETLGAWGADRVLHIDDEALNRYQGGRFAGILRDLAADRRPSLVLMVQSPETADLSARLAALMDAPAITRAVDLRKEGQGKTVVIRPVANGFLFETLLVESEAPPIVCFLPSVLTPPEPGPPVAVEIQRIPAGESPRWPEARVMEVMEASEEDLSLEEADVIVSGGRGAGRDSFRLIHELAGALGGVVAGSRPVVDRQILPFDRQIGQTGKTVAPRLMMAFGISGANEFTAGMEKSEKVIAVNRDPRARIFEFADLGAVGDLGEILPILIKRLKEDDEPR